MRVRYFTPLEEGTPPVGLILHVTGALNHIYMHSEHQLCSSISFKDRAFLSRISTLTRDIDIANLSVCLSVRPSVTFRYWMKTAWHMVIAFSPYDSPIILVLSASNIFTKFRRGQFCGGAKYRWGIKFRDFLPISRYISQTVQDRAIVTMAD